MALSRFDDALRVYEQIGLHWLRGPKEYTLLADVRDELNRARRSAKGVAHD